MPEENSGVWGGAPASRNPADSGCSGVAYRREAFVHSTLNQDMATCPPRTTGGGGWSVVA